MADYASQFDAFLSAMVGYLQNPDNWPDGVPKLTDFNPGSVIYTLLSAVAVPADALGMAVFMALLAAYVTTAIGTDLDNKAADYGITRKAAIAASNTFTFHTNNVATADLPIPAGSLISTLPTSTSAITTYATTAAAILPAGQSSITVAATCQTVGSAGNINAGTALLISSAIPGIDTVTIDNNITNGADAESDDLLRARVLDWIRNPGTSGNINDYQQWALAVDGVTGVRVIPIWNGPGTVKVIIIGPNYQAPSSDLVAAVQNVIDPTDITSTSRKAPVGATVTVAGAQAVSINIVATVILDSSNPVSLSTIQTNFISAMESYLSGMALQSNTVRYARICSTLVDQTGVVDFASCTVNGGTTNVSITNTQVAVLGTVTLSAD